MASPCMRYMIRYDNKLYLHPGGVAYNIGVAVGDLDKFSWTSKKHAVAIRNSCVSMDKKYTKDNLKVVRVRLHLSVIETIA